MKLDAAQRMNPAKVALRWIRYAVGAAVYVARFSFFWLSLFAALVLLWFVIYWIGWKPSPTLFAFGLFLVVAIGAVAHASGRKH